MKIAAVTDDAKSISAHFGRATKYAVITLEDGRITGYELREKVGHREFQQEGSHNHEHHDHAHGHGMGMHSAGKHRRMFEAIPDCQILLARGMGQGAYNGLQEIGERVHAFAHLSHVYSHGASFYVTYLFRVAPDPDETLERWRCLKGAASQAIVAAGGTISHQHGVGIDHRQYLPAEKGELGMKVLVAARQLFDPQSMMNPGKLLDDERPSPVTREK